MMRVYLQGVGTEEPRALNTGSFGGGARMYWDRNAEAKRPDPQVDRAAES
jgi:hypothetical protein